MRSSDARLPGGDDIAVKYFDYESVAREAGIPDDKLEEIVRLMYAEFPKDQMMAELHILQACDTVLEGDATLDEILGKLPSEAAGRG